MTDPDALLRLLSQGNPWWASGRLPDRLVAPYRRQEFEAIAQEIDARPITALAGPRQVGKTTLLYQLVEDRLAAGIPPRHILFVSFDLPGLAALADSPLNDALRVYGERVLQRPWRDLPGQVLVLLDEIAKVPAWHGDLKGWFDLGYDLKFFVSDSSLPALRRGAEESLAGRISLHVLPPWGYADVLMYREGRRPWQGLRQGLRAALQDSLAAGRPDRLLEVLRDLDLQTAGEQPRLLGALERYLLVDGFPELLSQEDLPWCARRLHDYLSLILARDLYRHFEIRAPGVLEDLLGLVAKETGQRISYRGWAETLGLQERTLKDYLDHLERTLLVAQAEYFARSRAKRIRRQRKVYLLNVGLRNVLLGRLDEGLLRDPSHLGPSVEALVHDHARRLAGALSPEWLPRAFYWRDRRGREVDVVVPLGDRVLPVEVKHRGDPGRGLEGLRAFLEAHPEAPFGLVVTRDRLELRDRLLFLPLEAFLLLA